MRMMLIVPMMFLGACQTTPKPATPATQTWEEFIRDHPDTFIESRDQQLLADRLRWERLGMAKDYEAIRAQVDRYLPPGIYTLQASGATAAVLRRQRVESTSLQLIALGYRRQHLEAPAQALSLVGAAASSFANVDALVLLSPIVVIADFDRVDERADGSADLVYRVSETIKAGPAQSSELRLFRNGPTRTVSAPAAPPPPPPPPNLALQGLDGHARIVLYIQPPETLMSSAAANTSIGRMVFSIMPVDGERVLPGYHSTTAETTLAAVRAAAQAQACSPGYIPVVAGNAPPQSC